MNDNRLIAENLSVAGGRLYFAGKDVCALAEKYGTPCYLFDEERIRENCRRYIRAMSAAFGEGQRVLYASKAASFKHIYRVMKEEGMGADVVSRGEIYTAYSAGFPMENCFFHSNNKTDADIAYAMDKGVGYFVCDNCEEIKAISAEAQRRGTVQKILLRLTPGIDPHTFEAVNTGKVDSKFGFAIETGQAEEAVRLALALPGTKLSGFHCHVGSQLFDFDVYIRAAKIMLDFIASVSVPAGYTPEILDLGGGCGVRYLPEQTAPDIEKNVSELADAIKAHAAALGTKIPTIMLEPGRSIVADAGLTLYTAGSVKRIPGYLNYVSVDGGMTDNVRYALYRAPYTVLPANKMNEPADMECTLAGRCCESGDLIQCGVRLPQSTERGDIIAVCTTGAYNYSMASNYNRIPRPPVVMLTSDGDFLAVRRETEENVCALDE